MSQVGLILQFSDLTFDQKSATTQANQFTAAAHCITIHGITALGALLVGADLLDALQHAHHNLLSWPGRRGSRGQCVVPSPSLQQSAVRSHLVTAQHGKHPGLLCILGRAKLVDRGRSRRSPRDQSGTKIGKETVHCVMISWPLWASSSQASSKAGTARWIISGCPARHRKPCPRLSWQTAQASRCASSLLHR
jgi:hypothetical protein